MGNWKRKIVTKKIMSIEKKDAHVVASPFGVKVENSLRTDSPYVSICDQMNEVVRREFEKIKSGSKK